jgi:predicted GNAT family acetyltransferase
MSDIVLEENKNRFVGTLESGDEYYIQYNKEKNIIDCFHTFVPHSGRGQGLAGKLVIFAFEYCIDNNYKLKPSCSYISDNFLKKEKYLKYLPYVAQ